MVWSKDDYDSLILKDDQTKALSSNWKHWTYSEAIFSEHNDDLKHQLLRASKNSQYTDIIKAFRKWELHELHCILWQVLLVKFRPWKPLLQRTVLVTSWLPFKQIYMQRFLQTQQSLIILLFPILYPLCLSSGHWGTPCPC